MENKIEAFEAYLGSLRRDAEERFKEKSKKFTYKELVKRHVIAETEIEEGLLKKSYSTSNKFRSISSKSKEG